MKKNLTVIGCALALAAVAPGQAQATLINVDFSNPLSPSPDTYLTGAAVFGTDTSVWNSLNRQSSASQVALKDDTGTLGGVTVSYTRSLSTSVPLSFLRGQYTNLASSHIKTGVVDIAGLVPGGTYDLAIFEANSGGYSFTVGSETKTISRVQYDWSSLTEGKNYVLFRTDADSTGKLSFTPGTTAYWSAFQLQSVAAAVPEPWTPALVVAGLGWAAAFTRRRSAGTHPGRRSGLRPAP